MTRNVGGIDRALRLVAGVLLLACLVLLDGDVRWIGLVGLVPLTTAALGWCPLYSLLGINTCPARRQLS